MDAKKIYKKLFAYFGPQGWWPIFDKKENKCVYGLQPPDSFEICVGAILTQNTAWKNIERALANLCMGCHPEGVLMTEGSHQDCDGILRDYPQNDSKNILTPQFILNCKNLESLIQPAGYYNQKAKKLRIFSEWWLKIHPNPPLRKEGVRKCASPFCKGGLRGILSARQELLSLWGIGPETADSMLLYAFNKPIFIIDAYTKRLCKEYGVEFNKYDDYRQFFESQLPKNVKLFNEYHALIVAWGKLHSKDRKKAKEILNIEY